MVFVEHCWCKALADTLVNRLVVITKVMPIYYLTKAILFLI